ncbi:MAG: DNA mismatch repair protein MutS [Oscillospiraceae bacterium]|nr:DNA mismatch repair protein MutS [Oscillospiraceae bacterium]
MAELTPMRKQYLKIKQEFPDCLLFFRLGDFYEMFDEDAKTASNELDLTLTTRDRNKPEEEKVPMCGVPYHSYEAYLSRLIAKGYKVAICEQTEDPAKAKGLVEREVVRVVTPGTVVDASMLEEGRNNYIAACLLEEQGAGLCFCDLSTGSVSVTAFSGEGARSYAMNELGRFAPSEIVLSEQCWQDQMFREFLKQRLGSASSRGGSRFDLESARKMAEAQFENVGAIPENPPWAMQAAGALLSYLYETQKTDLSYIRSVEYYASGRYMELDLTARRNLELTETLRGKEKRGSLLWVLDHTRTAMGGRTLRQWIERPLLSPTEINGRLTAVAELVDDLVTRQELRLALREVTDLERLIGRIIYGNTNCKDLAALNQGLSKVPCLRQLLAERKAPLLQRLTRRLVDLSELREELSRAIVDDPPLLVREGGMIRAGYNEEVDRLNYVLSHSKELLADIETRERERTGIRQLRVRYNKVFGYYIEVPRAQSDRMPSDYVRKQTLANNERFINSELKELENTIFNARDRIGELEYQIFSQLKQRCAAKAEIIQSLAGAIAQIDVLASLAEAAVRNQYTMPIVDDGTAIQIVDGRHPVVEQVLKDSFFVPNDTVMDGRKETLAIITGPNMAGKSTYMRQVALICLMAQIGSFVPARSARLGVVDRVFTRIGASDDLAAGQSTFMVEMSEVAEILKHATSRSLLILDEIGRGTSTYDGMSIARAVLEYCADKKKLGAKTLFATHYHELTELEESISGVSNYHIAARKRGDDIVFLRKIVRGGADQSYGIEVAKLAGVPSKVISRARKILDELEAGERPLRSVPAPQDSQEQISMGDMAGDEVLRQLRLTEVNTLTPIEAMNLLFEWKKML